MLNYMKLVVGGVGPKRAHDDVHIAHPGIAMEVAQDIGRDLSGGSHEVCGRA
jgi:hypothetical protein